MREKAIEQRLVQRVTELGGLCYKFSSPNNAGVPDRIVLLPGRAAIFVELKAPGEEPTKLQAHVHEEIRARGFQVEVIDSKAGVDDFIMRV